MNIKACSENRISLLSVSIDVSISHFFSKHTLLQKYKNNEKIPIEAVYSFPIPDSCAVCGFEANIDGKIIVGSVVKKEDADDQYKQAMDRGDGAFMASQDSPNIFTANIGNVLPDQSVIIKFSYVCELDQHDDIMSLTIPSTILPRYINQNTLENEKIETIDHMCPPTIPITPYKLSVRIVAECASNILEVSCPTHPVKISVFGTAAEVNLNGDGINLDRDFVVNYRLSNPHEASAFVARDGDKKIIAVNLFPSLKNMKRVPCDFQFLVDCSGSMAGDSIESAKKAMIEFIRLLGEDDKFNIVTFGTGFKSYLEKSVKANVVNKNQCEEWILELAGDGGGTEILPALKSVLKDSPSKRSKIIIILTDGGFSNEQECCQLIRKNRENCNVFTIGIGYSHNTYAINSISRSGGGRAVFITNSSNEDIKQKVADQVVRFSSSFLKNVVVDYGELKIDLMTPQIIPALFDSDRLTLYARVIGGNATKISVLADSPSGPLCFSAKIDMEKATLDSPIPQLMARAAIQGLNENANLYSPNDEQEAKNKILDLSLKYQILSSQSKYILVDHREAGTQGLKAEKRIVPIMTLNGYGAAGIGPSGVPNSYPLVMGIPFDRAYLRPLVDCIYDTEYYDPSKPSNKLSFFQRPIACKFLNSNEDKHRCETNLNQSAMLDYPREFSINGFGIFFEAGTAREDIEEISKNAVFEFLFMGNRPIFRRPLSLFPNLTCQTNDSNRPDKIIRIVDGKEIELSIINDMDSQSIVPFESPHDKELLRINPGQRFGVVIYWKAPPKVSKPMKIIAVINGYIFQPI